MPSNVWANCFITCLQNNPLGRCLGLADDASDFAYTLDFTECGSRERDVPDARIFPFKEGDEGGSKANSDAVVSKADINEQSQHDDTSVGKTNKH
jgi:hypothetical protein